MCHATIANKRSTMRDHLKGPLHKKSLEEQARVQRQHKSIVTMIEDAPFPERTTFTPEQLALKAGPVETALACNKPLTILTEFSEFLAPKYAVLATKRAGDFIPYVADAHNRRVISTVKDKPLTIIFDGTQTNAEMFAIIGRYVNQDMEPKQILLRLGMYAHAWTSEDLAHELAQALFSHPDDKERPGLGISRKNILAFVCDGGSINVPGLNMMKNRCAEFETSPIFLCVDHFLNNLGKRFNPPELELFTLNFTSIFRSLKTRFLWEKFGQEFYDLLLGSVPRVSQVRWWSRFRLLKYICERVEIFEQFVVDTDYDWDQPAAFNELSVTIKDALKWAKIRLQLALLVDVFEVFVTATTLLESDCLTILFAHDQIAALEIQLFKNTHRPTVRAVVEQLKLSKVKLNRQVPTHEISEDWSKYADGLLAGCRDYYREAEREHGRLSMMPLFKAARLLDPSRALELIDIGQVNYEVNLSQQLAHLNISEKMVR